MKSKELLEINISGLKIHIGEITKILPTKCPQYNLHSILLLSGLMSPRVESAVDQVFLSQSQHQHMAGNMAHMCFTITQVSSGLFMLLGCAYVVVFLKLVPHVDVLELSPCRPVELADKVCVVPAAVACVLQVSWAPKRRSKSEYYYQQNAKSRYKKGVALAAVQCLWSWGAYAELGHNGSLTLCRANAALPSVCFDWSEVRS